MLLTTYAVLLEMLFTSNNVHLEGLNAVRKQLRAISPYHTSLSPRYFVTLIWHLLNDGVLYFNECIDYEVLERAEVSGSRVVINWPETNLHILAFNMKGKTTQLEHLGMPTEWSDWVSLTPGDLSHVGTPGQH